MTYAQGYYRSSSASRLHSVLPRSQFGRSTRKTKKRQRNVNERSRRMTAEDRRPAARTDTSPNAGRFPGSGALITQVL